MTTSEIPLLITLEEILKKVPYSRVHLWRMEKLGQFPKRLKLGANRVAWLEAEITSWINERSDARKPQT